MTGRRLTFAFLGFVFLCSNVTVTLAQSSPADQQQQGTQADLDGLRPLGQPQAAVPETDAADVRPPARRLGSRPLGSVDNEMSEEVQKSRWQNLKDRLFGSKVTGPSGETVVRDADGRWHVIERGADASASARAEYEEAMTLFRQEQYSAAARAFKRLAKRYEKTSVAEDSLYMRAECLYMQDKLPAAEDCYTKLLVDFPTTRYLPQAVQRIYDIAYYWLEDSRLRSQGQPTKHYRITHAVNLFDRTRPLFDTNGRAVEAIENIQQYDPLGPLSDDAGMMAGAHSFVNEDYIQAAGYYEQVVADQPKSEHAARAYLLGAQAYLRGYQGPNYDGRNLDDAERLTRMAMAQGQNLTDEQRERLEKDLRLIYLERARRDFIVAQEYQRMRRLKAAIYCYSLVVKKYPDTDWARRAQEEIHHIQANPQSESRLPFFASLFESSNPAPVDSSMPGGSLPGLSDSDAASQEQSPQQKGESGSSIFSRLPFMSR